MGNKIEVERPPVDKLFVALKAFIVHEGKVLLLQENEHYADGTNRGRWEMPGGRVQPGEHFADALAREVAEETGLTVTLERPFMLGEWWPQVRGEQWHIIATFCLCSAESNKVMLGEDHGQYIWIDPKEYGRYTNFAPYIKEAFEAYLALESKG